MSSLSIFVVEILLVHIIRPRLVRVDELWWAKALGGFMNELEASSCPSYVSVTCRYASVNAEHITIRLGNVDSDCLLRWEFVVVSWPVCPSLPTRSLLDNESCCFNLKFTRSA